MSVQLIWLAYVLVAVLVCTTDGNRYKELDLRLIAVEQRLTDGKLDMYKFEGVIQDMNRSLTDIEMICIKNNGHSVEKAMSFKSEPMSKADDALDTIIAAFAKEKTWMRKELQKVKDQTKELFSRSRQHSSRSDCDHKIDVAVAGLKAIIEREMKTLNKSLNILDGTVNSEHERALSELRNDSQKTARRIEDVILVRINKLEKEFEHFKQFVRNDVSKLNRNIIALEERVNAVLQVEVSKLKDYIKDQDTRYTSAIEDKLSEIQLEIFKTETNCVTNSKQIQASVDQLSVRLSILENQGSVQKVLCSSGWTHYSGFCYRFYSLEVAKHVAEILCTREGATLVDSNSEAEGIFIRKLTGGLDSWLGASQTYKSMQNPFQGLSKDRRYKKYEDLYDPYYVDNQYRYDTSTSGYRDQILLPFVCKKAAA